MTFTCRLELPIRYQPKFVGEAKELWDYSSFRAPLYAEFHVKREDE